MKGYYPSLLLSFLIHGLFLSLALKPLSFPVGEKEQSENSKKRLTLRLKKLGIETNERKDTNYLKLSELNQMTIKNLDAFTKKEVENNRQDYQQNFRNDRQLAPAKKRYKYERAGINFSENFDNGLTVESRGGFRSQSISPLLSNSMVNIKMDIPQGVKFNQLNRYDKILYGFTIRLQSLFQSSIIKNFLDAEFANPNFSKQAAQQTTKIRGKVTYDKNGQLIRVYSLNGAQYKLLQDAFMNSLNDVHIIQNIPDLVFNENDNFHLEINLEVY